MTTRRPLERNDGPVIRGKKARELADRERRRLRGQDQQERDGE